MACGSVSTASRGGRWRIVDPLSGDSLTQTVYWHGDSDLGTAEDAPIVLHFKLRAAKLFSFTWA